jgi:hypothetical protein
MSWAKSALEALLYAAFHSSSGAYLAVLLVFRSCCLLG